MGASKKPQTVGAHPRAGGENCCSVLSVNQDVGSSPRGRGKPRPDPRHLENDGLIPARAGKTGWRCVWPRSSGAHPRAGGENNMEDN